MLRVGEAETVRLPFALAAGIAAKLGDEPLEGPVQVDQRLLQAMMRNVLEPGQLRLESAELGRLVVIIEALLAAIPLAALLECQIP